MKTLTTCLLAAIAIAVLTAAGLDGPSVAATSERLVVDPARLYVVTPSFDVAIEALEEPRVAASDVPALSGTAAQVAERFEH